MNRILFGAIVVSALASPVFAQPSSTCAEYRAIDDVGRLRTATELESAASQMSTRTFTAGEIRSRLDTRCKADTAMTVIRALEDVVE